MSFIEEFLESNNLFPRDIIRILKLIKEIDEKRTGIVKLLIKQRYSGELMRTKKNYTCPLNRKQEMKKLIRKYKMK